MPKELIASPLNQGFPICGYKITNNSLVVSDRENYKERFTFLSPLHQRDSVISQYVSNPEMIFNSEFGTRRFIKVKI